MKKPSTAQSSIIKNYSKNVNQAKQFAKSLPRIPLLTVIVQFDLPHSTDDMMENPKKTITRMLSHNKACTEIIEQEYDAQTIKEMGDAVLALFHSIPAACDCALNIIHNLQKYGKGICTKATVTAGTVEVITTRCEPDVYGLPVNLCNRMSKYAKDGSVLIEESRFSEVKYWLADDKKIKFGKPQKMKLLNFGFVKLREISLK